MANALLDLLQGASNSAAGTVSAPVDAISWLLRKAGIPIPSAPLGGSDWMAQQGLTRQPTNALAGAIGEGIGNAMPVGIAARAPEFANALLRMGENAAIPRMLGAQRGVIDVQALRDANPLVDFSLLQSGDGAPATLSSVVVPKEARGQGVGTKFMQDLASAADADGAQLLLSPSTDFGATSKGRLQDFYRRFGFVQNKGRNRDFSTMESMYRNPSND